MLLSNQLVSKDDSKTQALPITWLCPPLHPQKPLFGLLLGKEHGGFCIGGFT